MSWYTDPSVSYKRVNGLIQPVCKSRINKGTVVFYEVPVKSVNHFTLDIIRYTMQCVYRGEVLFPCSFNTDVVKNTLKNKRSKVFFDQAFGNSHKRNVTDKLAMALMDTCKKPFLFKALGAFSQDISFNCMEVSFLNGETYLVVIKDLDQGEVLVKSPRDIKVPMLKDNFEEQFKAMDQTLVEDIEWFNIALGTRESAARVRPCCELREVQKCMDKGLEERVQKYAIERQLGFTEVREKIVHMESGAPHDSDDSENDDMARQLEDKYNELMEEHFGWTLV